MYFGVGGGRFLRGHLGLGKTSGAVGMVLDTGQRLMVRQMETTSCP